MSDLTVTFNEEAKATFAAAQKAFGLNGPLDALSLASALLKIATKAKNEGKDLAVIQDIRNGNQLVFQVDDVVDIKEGVTKTPNGVQIRTASRQP